MFGVEGEEESVVGEDKVVVEPDVESVVVLGEPAEGEVEAMTEGTAWARSSLRQGGLLGGLALYGDKHISNTLAETTTTTTHLWLFSIQ